MAASVTAGACGASRSCEARLRSNGSAGAAELKVGGRTIKESDIDWLFLRVDGWSGRRHHCALHVGCAWTRSVLQGRVAAVEQFKLQHVDLLASEAAHGSRTMDQWSFLPGVHWNRIGLRACAGCVVRIGHFQVHLSVACDWCGLG